MTAAPFLRPPARWTRDLRDAVERVLATLWQPGAATAIDQALEQGDLDRALALLLGSQLDDNVTFPRWSPVTSALQDLLLDRAGVTARKEIDPAILQGAVGPRMRVRFDAGNVHAWDAMRTYQFGLIRGLDTETREGVRTWLRAGVQAGWNPRATARHLKGIIGLTPRQAQAVANYRTALLQREENALQRALRDHRADPTVRAHLEGTRPLSAARIEQLVAHYEQRYRAYRAEVIARTETLRAGAVAQRAMWESAAAQGLIDPAHHTKRWVAHLDDRTRPEHVLMHNTTVGLTDLFDLPLSGERVWGPPHDPNCRCVLWVREVA